MDGREIIRQTPRMAWEEPFESYISPGEIRKRGKEARRRQKEGEREQPASQTSASETRPPRKPQLVEHYVMNLPDSALEFLDSFVGLYESMVSEPGFVEAIEERGTPMLHVYCFTREIEPDTARIDICEVRILSYCELHADHSNPASDQISRSCYRSQNGGLPFASRPICCSEQGYVLPFFPTPTRDSHTSNSIKQVRNLIEMHAIWLHG